MRLFPLFTFLLLATALTLLVVRVGRGVWPFKHNCDSFLIGGLREVRQLQLEGSNWALITLHPQDIHTDGLLHGLHPTKQLAALPAELVTVGGSSLTVCKQAERRRSILDITLSCLG